MTATAPLKHTSTRRTLYSPLVDFLLLGGASFFALPLAAFIHAQDVAAVALAMFWLSFIINYPHFAHSYQIFYRDYHNKIAGKVYSRHLRLRYIFAGLAIPVAIFAYYATALRSEDMGLLRLSLNAMGFFVGWHYVKQGYGILIVDSVLTRSYFNDRDKKALRFNAYTCWIFFYLLMNYVLEAGIRQGGVFGVKSYFFVVPVWLLAVTGSAMVASTTLALAAGYGAWRRNGGAPIPLNGWTAYFFSLYVWLGAYFSPSVLAVIPALHSLQYLAVVWRFETNRQKSVSLSSNGARSLTWRLAVFGASGLILGMLAFVTVPLVLDRVVEYDKAVLGEHFFALTFAVFINIHHYFLDNVMWRKDNPDVAKNLFASS